MTGVLFAVDGPNPPPYTLPVAHPFVGPPYSDPPYILPAYNDLGPLGNITVLALDGQPNVDPRSHSSPAACIACWATANW
jgi:hypothetical protein